MSVVKRILALIVGGNMWVLLVISRMPLAIAVARWGTLLQFVGPRRNEHHPEVPRKEQQNRKSSRNWIPYTMFTLLVPHLLLCVLEWK